MLRTGYSAQGGYLTKTINRLSHYYIWLVPYSTTVLSTSHDEFIQHPYLYNSQYFTIKNH